MDPTWQPFITAIDVIGVVVTCVFSTKAWNAAHAARRDRLVIEQVGIRMAQLHQVRIDQGPPTPRDRGLR